MITGRITFLRPAATATGRTAQSCTRFSDQNVYVTSRSMWECLWSPYLGCWEFVSMTVTVSFVGGAKMSTLTSFFSFSFPSEMYQEGSGGLWKKVKVRFFCCNTRLASRKSRRVPIWLKSDLDQIIAFTSHTWLSDRKSPLHWNGKGWPGYPQVTMLWHHRAMTFAWSYLAMCHRIVKPRLCKVQSALLISLQTCSFRNFLTDWRKPPIDHCWSYSAICKGYRLRWRSDIWRTDRGVAKVRSPGIRPATEHDIRHNAPGLLETVDQLLRTKVRRKLLNQDKPSRLASYALQQHKAKSAKLAASEFSFLLAVLRRSRWVRAVEQAWDENFETSASDGRAW